MDFLVQLRPLLPSQQEVGVTRKISQQQERRGDKFKLIASPFQWTVLNSTVRHQTVVLLDMLIIHILLRLFTLLWRWGCPQYFR